jgi:hypothetical protein
MKEVLCQNGSEKFIIFDLEKKLGQNCFCVVTVSGAEDIQNNVLRVVNEQSENDIATKTDIKESSVWLWKSSVKYSTLKTAIFIKG